MSSNSKDDEVKFSKDKRKRTNTKSKALSCQRCRSRKIRCNFEFPCSNCVKSGAECVKVENDMRKRRPSASYVKGLETRLETLQDFFENFKKAESISAKQDLLESMNLNEIINEEKHDSLNFESTFEEERAASVYGPISVYGEIVQRKQATQPKCEDTSLSAMNKDCDILHCLKLFFTWQYPTHNFFIFRESFLTDFFSAKSNSLYCSKALVWSLCSLGACMSEIDHIRSRSAEFYNKARSNLLLHLNTPTIASLQSFLLLAFYDISNGSNSSGWMLSGNAMRMGFDIGFQLNPEEWFLRHEELSKLDIAIRSRIYWGSYLADHFISMLLGRPSVLKVSDATIPETNELPNLEWIGEFMYVDPKNKHKNLKDASIADPLKNVINLINISDNILNEVFTRTRTDQNGMEDIDLTSRIKKLNHYNTQISKWRKSLASDFTWDRDKLREVSDNPNQSCVRYYYYILILCLNRPFLSISDDEFDENDPKPSNICHDSIEDLYIAMSNFKSTHGLRKASIFIVYCSIISISIIMLTNNPEKLMDEQNSQLYFFMNILNECSKTWKLAEKSYNYIKVKIQKKLNIEKTPFGEHRMHMDIIDKSHKETMEKEKISGNQEIVEDVEEADIAQSCNEHDKIFKTMEKRISESSPKSPGINKSEKEMDFEFADLETSLYYDEGQEFLGGPPVLMTSDLFNENWESLFPGYIFS